MTNQLENMTAIELVALFKQGAASPVEAAQSVLGRAQSSGAALNALSWIDEAQALTAARASEQRYRDKSPKSRLDGVPISIKDNIQVEGMPTMFGSLAVERDSAMGPDSPSTARLRDAGLVIFAKTCLPDFAHKICCDSPLTGVTRNPWNLDHTPGGSSGGSAAAVAAGIGPLSIGTDGGASIRLPAAFTGTFGYKPSFGRVPHYPRGAFAMLSHVGPMTRSVEDAVATMDIISQPDAQDWYALPQQNGPVPSSSVAGLRIAYSENLGLPDLTIAPDVLARIREARTLLQGAGAIVEEANPPAIQRATEIHGQMWMCFSAHLAGSLGPRREKLDATLKKYAEIGDILPKDAFLKASLGRGEVGREINIFFEKYDLLICPVFPTAAPTIAETRSKELPLPYLTSWGNQTGLPAASIYCGLGALGLPVGLQIVGRQYADRQVLSACLAFERAFGRAPLPPFALDPSQRG
jgi:aspartyl-tRNA(Asn)/glutamyl-tRNA(Gln) amidotransferase subunit A